VRVAFFGLPLAALLLRGDGHEIVRACICRDGAIGTRRLQRALGPEQVRVKPDLDDDGVYRWLRASPPDLVVSWFWTRRIPARVLELGARGAFGVHPSLLPRHRGPDPYFWAIESGDAVTGVTAHELAEEYDTGAVLAARELAIDPAWDAWTLARRLDRPSLSLLREVATAFAAGRPPRAVPQDEARATAAPEPDEEMLAVAWARPAEAIARRVRAAGPFPGAFTEIGDALVTLTRVRVTDDFPRALAPGEAAVRSDGTAVVRAEDSAVELLAGRDEGDGSLGPRELAAVVAAARS
jgi:methionyl-tRNA formyltransferase